MRARGVVGKRIKRIDQQRCYNACGGYFFYVLQRMVLEDGTVLYPVEHELPGDLATELRVFSPKREPQKGSAS